MLFRLYIIITIKMIIICISNFYFWNPENFNNVCILTINSEDLYNLINYTNIKTCKSIIFNKLIIIIEVK